MVNLTLIVAFSNKNLPLVEIFTTVTPGSFCSGIKQETNKIDLEYQKTSDNRLNVLPLDLRSQNKKRQ